MHPRPDSAGRSWTTHDKSKASKKEGLPIGDPSGQVIDSLTFAFFRSGDRQGLICDTHTATGLLRLPDRHEYPGRRPRVRSGVKRVDGAILAMLKTDVLIVNAAFGQLCHDVCLVGDVGEAQRSGLLIRNRGGFAGTGRPKLMQCGGSPGLGFTPGAQLP